MSLSPESRQAEKWLRMFSWISPAFPTGGYAYSHGLEWAINNGDITDVASLVTWIKTLLYYGSLRSDMIFLRQAWRANSSQEIRHVAEFACASAASRERYEETVNQGEAFLKAADIWSLLKKDDDMMDIRWPLPVAQGVIFRRNDVAEDMAAISGGHVAVSGLVSAALRLVPLGQTDSLRAVKKLEHHIIRSAQKTRGKTLEETGSGCFRSDLASMQHETQQTRLFRT